MAENDLRAAAFPKLDETQIAALGRCAEVSLKQYRAGEKLFEVAGDVRSGSVKRVASAVGRRSNGGLLRARVLEGHVNDAQSPTWPPRENHPDAAYHKCRDVSAKDFRIDLGAQSIRVEIMKCHIEFKGFAPQKESQKQITDLVTKIEKKTKAFPLDVVFLRLMIEENTVRALYHVSITLELPEKPSLQKKRGTTSMKLSGMRLPSSRGSLKRTKRRYAAGICGSAAREERSYANKDERRAVRTGYREVFFAPTDRVMAN